MKDPPQSIWGNLNLMKKNRLSVHQLSDIRLNLKYYEIDYSEPSGANNK